MKKLRDIFVLVVLTSILSSSFAGAELLRRDDFRDRKSWWFWYSLCTDAPWVHNGVLHLYLPSASGSRECGSGIGAHGSQDNIFGNYTAIMRVKALTPMRAGSRGWGFWDFQNPWPGDLSYSDYSWFMRQYDPFDSSQTWWLALIRNEETNSHSYADLESLVDESDWHIYKIERHPEFIAFYVDEALVHYTDSVHTEDSQSLHIWIDNFIYPWDLSLPIAGRAFSEPSALVVDFVEIYDGQLGSSQPPAGSLLLKEMPNETGSGETSFLWKEYTFESPGGKTLVLITARAEDYGDFSDDDDIRIVIDDIDLGWDTVTSFDGKVLDGKNKSLIYMDNFEKGEHYLDIYGEITPILYDVTVIGAENGDIILNEELDEQAPGGNDYLWKEYSFNCANDEEVTLFISASAHENTGEDDDIRIVLADEDFGWDTDYSFSGDQLYGEAKALTIWKYLSKGEHTLRIYADQTPILHNVIIYGSEEVNNPPIADDQSVTIAKDTPVAITLTASDVDGDALTYSIVSTPGHGSLSGTAPNVTYTPNSDYTGPDSFTFTVNDGTVDSTAATVSISITVQNDPPVANDQAVMTDEDTPVVVTLTGSDVEGDPLTFTVIAAPSNGTLTGTAPNLTYTPNADYNGSDSFTFKANDGQSDSNTATVTITVAPQNDVPVANDQAVTTSEDTPVAITVTGNDADGDPLSFTIVTKPTNGSLSGTAPNVTYTPNSDYTGPDTFTFKANDGEGDSNVATVSITVTEANDPPVADDQNVTTPEDTPIAITLTGNDADGDPLSFTIVTNPTNGSLSGTAPNVTYTPNPDYNGPDSFIFKANDGTDDSNTATVSITVYAVNDAPVADDQSVTTSEDTSIEIALTARDADGDTLIYNVVTGPVNGTLSGTAPNVTYTPNPDYNGPDSFTYHANDGEADSNEATVSITVMESNEPPVADDQNVTTPEDTPAGIILTALDADGGPLTYIVVSSPEHGTLSGTAPNVTYTPNPDYNGPDSFTFKANDGHVDSNVATVSITVTEANDAPVVTDIPDQTIAEVGTFTIINLDDYVTDVDNTDEEMTWSYSGNVELIVDISGRVATITIPNPDWNGSETITFTATDTGSLSDSDSATFTVTAVNDAPVANNDTASTTEDMPVTISVLANDTDADGDALTVSSVTQGSNGGVTTDGTTVTYTPNANFNGTDTFTYTASDGNGGTDTAEVTVNVGAENDPPVADDQSVTTPEDTPVAITLTASDVDGDALTYIVVAGPANGVLSGTAPSLTYTPASEYTGPDSFTFEATDGEADSNEATVSITVESSSPPEDLIHVNTIEVTKEAWWIIRRGIARVQVVDTEGSPVEAATITGQWSGGANDADQFTTGSDGWGTTYSDWRWGDATFTFCVTNVTKEGWDYDPQANVVICGNTD